MLWEILLPASGTFGIGAILSTLFLPTNVFICYLALPLLLLFH